MNCIMNGGLAYDIVKLKYIYNLISHDLQLVFIERQHSNKVLI